jgi:hypothetical protein
VSEAGRLVVVIACYGGVGAAIGFHATWYHVVGTRLAEHMRAHHPDEWQRRGAPQGATRGVLPDVGVWNWLWRPPGEAADCDDFLRLRGRGRLVVFSLLTTTLVLLATAQAFWSTLS